MIFSTSQKNIMQPWAKPDPPDSPWMRRLRRRHPKNQTASDKSYRRSMGRTRYVYELIAMDLMFAG
ncbi:uncharacterized protein TRAVEDRAFT_29871 [Trametes versicolor FP-101664 SS1]|uniref:uncharacterized protein n=1 Tax=Trametes versicolor (strain FP-101664) TaxID=717944 RepID=UPI00046249FC|nr:uncharacterized protein TRAVEDRAFT_29871 [Trametes versicolor FP-101664 SS1]EIW58021.1 hypothetical protein TRAVEDRAFT_29871 [Trametes versicolor FP-101664 SS1]